jgi:hypothetical protein
MVKFINRIFCAIGMHGPNWYGNSPRWRSQMDYGFQRRCGDCGACWHGRQVESRDLRYLGGWRRIK